MWLIIIFLFELEESKGTTTKPYSKQYNISSNTQ